MKMHHLARALLALAALATAACGGAPAEPAAAGRVVLSINGGPAMFAVTTVTVSVAPAGVTADLTLDQPTGAFTGTLSVPAGAQVITARAFAGAVLVAEGSASVTITGGETMTVAITVLDVTGPEPTPDHAPILTALTASTATLEVGQPLALDATAVDVDDDPITFTWSASPVGCATLSPATSTSNGAASTTATAAIAGPCTLAVVASSQGLTDSLSTTVEVILPIVIDGTFVPQPVLGAFEFLAPMTAAVLRTDVDATVRQPWTAGAPVSVRLTWDATPWLARSVATLADGCGGTVTSTAATATSETFEWTPTGGPVCLLTASLERQGLIDAFAVATVVVPPAPACRWTEVAFHDLTTVPAGSVIRNGSLGGQAPAPVAGRTAWQQASDWNVLLIPHGLPAEDDVFAVVADVYVPAITTYRRSAGLNHFTTSATASGPLGTCQFLGGAWPEFWVRPGGPVTLEWWSGTCGNVLLDSSPIADPTAAWHTMRVEGVRSTCAYQALLDGSVISSWTGCDASGPFLNLYGHALGGVAGIAWSNLSIQTGTAACVP
jgi:hypothetical protein